ncbi:MAG: response regulator, partial [Vallitaleaceae bacterium]|nr:response regulator [Vallitaleaceae bacterium]
SNHGNQYELRFSISDTGVGISDQDMDKLFKVFSQIDGSYTREHGGSGLGLVISKQIVEMMGGRIWFESKKAVGSTFYFTTTVTAAMYENPKEVPEEPITKKQKCHVLIVEDDKVNQLVITRMLVEHMCSYDLAVNGKEAVDLHEKNSYDLILMDIQMPVMDGLQATTIIRKKEGNSRHTPIIALTAFALVGDRERFIASGMDEYLAKPVTMERLFTMINGIMLNEKPPSTGLELTPVLNTQEEVVLKEDMPTPIYQQSLKSLHAVMQQLVASTINKNCVEVEKIIHILKLSFERLNMNDFKARAFRIELAARRGNMEQVIEGVKCLEMELETIKETNL